MKHSMLYFLAFLVIFVSCKKEDDHEPGEIWKDSVFITNEGPFAGGTGTVLAYNRETGEVSEDLFEPANGHPLGNVVQSLAIHNDLVWIAVNNSNLIEVVGLEDFKSVATIENVTLPRYMVFTNDHAYVSCWDNTVKEINLADFTVEQSLPAGTGPDEMVIFGDELFVVNSGGFGVDSSISILSTNDQEHYGLLHLGHRPAGIARDFNDNIWVLCSGKGWNGFPAPGDTPGKLICIDPDTKQILTELEFADAGNHPDQLIINEDRNTLYFAYPDGIYAVSVSNPQLASIPFIPSATMYYALGYDPVTDMIFASDPIDYAQDGRIYRFNSADGSAVDSFGAGIIPGSFWFNK
jgi:hypothetical protein